MFSWSVFIRRSLGYYWRTHLWVVLGAAVSTAILVGALMIGDSVRYSLYKMSLQRLGETEYALSSSSRFFRAAIADSLAASVKATVAPVLQVPGIAVAPAHGARVNNVNIIGVDDRFWDIGKCPSCQNDFGSDDAVINTQLSARLHVSPGEEILVRVEQADDMPKDLPMAAQSQAIIAIHLKVKAIVDDDQFGRYSLKVNQTAPMNVFLPLQFLAAQLKLEGRANTILVKQRIPVPLELDVLSKTLNRKFRLSDAGYHIQFLKDMQEIELSSDRVFVEDRVGKVALQCGSNARPVLTYFVNQIRNGGRETPYSFVAGLDPSLFGNALKNDEIAINAWTARDLNAKIGDRLELCYFIIDPASHLIETKAVFQVGKILPTNNAIIASSLVPSIPGLADAENCRDWDSSLPIDLKRIRPKDEEYWNQYKTLPKACIAVDAAQELWRNRYGDLTSIRYPSRLNDMQELERELQSQLTPADFDLVFQPVRKQGLAAGREAMDFGQLFTSLSFFIIVSASLLTGMLFIFNIEQRTSEIGLLLAVGISPSRLRTVLMAEGACLALIGSAAGGILGFIYHLMVHFGLMTIWRDVIGGATLYMAVRPLTLAFGMMTGFIIACLVMWITLRKQARRTIRDLHAADTLGIRTVHRKKIIYSFLVSALGICAALFMVFFTDVQKNDNAVSLFFAAGVVLLGSGILLSRAFFLLKSSPSIHYFTLRDFIFKNLTRRPGRNLAIISLFACGIFVIFSEGANRQNALKNAGDRNSGTGGFAFWAETSMPVLADFKNRDWRSTLGLQETASAKVAIVPMRLYNGDDASCLNLNHVQRPRIIGVNPAEFADRRAFSFAKTADVKSEENPWRLLEGTQPDPAVIPAIADQTVLQWGLNKSLGDTIAYRDESGRPLYLKIVGALANSIFQGNLVISETNFIHHFPSTNGYRLFVMDAPSLEQKGVGEQLLWSLQDYGVELTRTGDRLNSFNSIQNTYLSIFLALGGLGLIIGSIGMMIVLLRNVAERRSELAVLKAVGWEAERISDLLIYEHVLLLAMGTVIGVLSSLLAVQPALTYPGNGIPWIFMALLLAAILGCGVLATIMAAHWSQRGNLVSALRNE